MFGLWSACASVGNILGAFLASSVLKYGYEVGLLQHQYQLVSLTSDTFDFLATVFFLFK